MLMSRELRPISVRVNETGKLCAPTGHDREIRGKSLWFVFILCLTLSRISKHVIETAVTTSSPAPSLPATCLAVSYLYVCAHMVPSVIRVLMTIGLGDFRFACSYP